MKLKTIILFLLLFVVIAFSSSCKQDNTNNRFIVKRQDGSVYVITDSLTNKEYLVVSGTGIIEIEKAKDK